MHPVLLCDPKALSAGHLGQLTVAITSKNSDTENATPDPTDYESNTIWQAFCFTQRGESLWHIFC